MTQLSSQHRGLPVRGGLMRSKMRLLILLIALSAVPFFSAPSEAKMAEPASVPETLKNTSPHTPSVSVYYLQELVKEGVMTREEADRTQQYMMFRYERRQKDLQTVEGMSHAERMNYMKKRRKERGNPLQEYAGYCGFTYERARDLMNAMHGSEKGTEYYEELMEEIGSSSAR